MEREFEGMTFGTSSSAFQIEGAWNEDGKGESIWDRFLHQPGKGKATGDIAADHYHHLEKDVALLKEIGVDAYRFSIAWTRIFPNGYGQVNKKGIAFYKRLIGLLKKEGIRSSVTLYHWDLPQKLQDMGGWTNRFTVTCFQGYAAQMFKEFGEDVDVWITFNEPWVSAFVGHADGKFAPGHRDFSEALLVAHNIMKAHGLAVREFRKGGYQGKIGITLDYFPASPFTDSEEDSLAAQRDRESHIGWFADPVFKGQYPEMLWNHYEKKGIILPEIASGDMELISEPTDFLGVNYYRSSLVRDAPGEEWPLDRAYIPHPGEKTFVNYRHEPEKFGEYLRYLKSTYDPKEIMITENGYSTQETVDHTGRVMDLDRIEYIYLHLEQISRVRKEGVPVTAYYVWSFMDDLEWTAGYTIRMGLVRVEFDSGKRLIKESGRWYSDVIRERSLKSGHRR